MAKETEAIGLADVIEGLRSELAEAVDRGKGKDIRFGLGEISIELVVAVAKTTGIEGSAGLKFWVVGEAKTGASRQSGTTRTQKVTVTLMPRRDREGRSSELALSRELD